MPGKEQIVAELGEVLLPNLVNQALVANDRAKYFLTLLQTARQRADHPEDEWTNLQSERTACGIEDTTLDQIVPQSRHETAAQYFVPGVGQLHQQLWDQLKTMVVPVAAADGLPNTSATAGEYVRRLDALADRIPAFEHDLISGDYIDEVTSAQPASGDSLHVLVMNLHQELNRLQRLIAAESIDGAGVYGVTDGDRPLIAAFMRGVNRTRRLKFDHPGLETTATRTQQQLVIQNDIGTTDAHVLVIRVTESDVKLTYTDVHLPRLIFFQNLFQRFSVQWEDTRSRRSEKLTESLYHLCVGTFVATKDCSRRDYLEFLGSRLVFLIDWNRARKRLQKLVPKRVGLEVLHWAAEKDLGHMAFLRVGGEQLVFDALHLSSRTPLPLGRRLSDIIGTARAGDFLKFTLKTAADGLLAGHSELLIRDEVRAELRHYLDTAHEGLLELAAEHAALIVELASAARDCLLRPLPDTDPAFSIRVADRAKRWEHTADGLLSKVRTAGGERIEAKTAAEILRVADDAADDLEEGIFLLTLWARHTAAVHGYGAVSSESREVLGVVANLLVDTAREYLKVVENARQIHRGSTREEMADFLQAVDHTISLEHQTDDAHRRAKASILTFDGDFKQLHFFTEVADNLEAASDSMMRAALMLRDYVLGEVITR